MSNQHNFLLSQAIKFLETGNSSSAELLLKQILKSRSDHADSLRILAVIYAQQGDAEKALDTIEKSIIANKRNGIAYSNKGNILLSLDRPVEAIDAYKIAIKISPNYSEAYSNLGNGFQEIQEYEKAISSYGYAIKLDPNNLNFKINLGNAYSRMGDYKKACSIYHEILEQDASNASAHFYLAQIKLYLTEFEFGWEEYEWRWLAGENDSRPLKTSKPMWQGQSFNGILYIWAEQGIGDQILYASILDDLRKLPQKKLISVDRKLLPIFRRSFPDFDFIDKEVLVPEDQYDQHLPIASLGKFFRKNENNFDSAKRNYLISDDAVASRFKFSGLSYEKKICGISWESSNQLLGRQKSIPLISLKKILQLKNYEFLNLQYGDISSQVQGIKNDLDINIIDNKKVDLYEDIDGVTSLIDSCDIILTTSNSTAHLAGALGKETLLLIPRSIGRPWYWHDTDGVSLWYPSIRIFKQETQGDWSRPIEAAKSYLESRFGA